MNLFFLENDGHLIGSDWRRRDESGAFASGRKECGGVHMTMMDGDQRAPTKCPLFSIEAIA